MEQAGPLRGTANHILHKAGIHCNVFPTSSQAMTGWYTKYINIWSVPHPTWCTTLGVCVTGASYVGSTVDMKRRWAKHKYDIRNDNWTSFGLARHFGQYDRLDRDTHMSRLEVILLDSCQEDTEMSRIVFDISYEISSTV